jgi:hypothetical protein
MDTPVSTTATPRSLTTRSIDFWMLGGASLVLWVAMFLLEGTGRTGWAVDHHFGNLVALSGSLALVCNYPHFMASYRLAYGQGSRFILRHWFQLLVVPVCLVTALGAGYLLYQQPADADGALHLFLEGAGLDTRIGLAPTIGQEVMNVLLNLMFFSVGWHYAKQAYGCMRVYANYDDYRLAPAQWRLVKACLFAIWFSSFVHANVGNSSRALQQIPYYTLGLPAWADIVALVLFVYLLSAVSLLFFSIHKINGRRPGINMLVPLVAFVAWWIPPLVQEDFYLWTVPFFHSLQYLAFVYKFERNELCDTHPASVGWRGGIIALGLVIAGFVAFELAPNTADVLLDTQGQLDCWFFFASAVIFINIHHYFIDNVVWRFSHPRIRENLLHQ